MQQSYYVHPSAIIDEGATIGKGCKIWHFVHIMGGAHIGEDCSIGQNVFIGNTARLGNRVKVQNNVSVYDSVIVEDDVFLGPSMVFTNVINPRSEVERKHEYMPTRVRKGATIGANATILCGLEIGEYAFVGAGAVVLRDIPSFALVVGNPAVQKGWMSKRGRKLTFDADGNAKCPEDGSTYRISGGHVTAL